MSYLMMFLCLLLVGGAVAGILYAVWYFTRPNLRVRMVTAAADSVSTPTTPGTSHHTEKRIIGGTAFDHADLVVESLQYALTDITLAESAELIGTGFNNPKNKMSGFFQQFDDTFYKSFGWAEARTNTTVKWIDLMDRPTLKTILAGVKIQPDNPMNFTSANMQFVSLNYLMPLRLQAKVTFPDGGTMVTREATRSVLVETDKSGHPVYRSEYDGDYRTTQPTELSTVTMNNGGIWLRLAEPIQMNQDTVSKSELVLVYDPYLNLRAQRMEVGETKVTSGYQAMVDTPGNQWLIPIMSTTPIVVPQGDQVWREIYRIEASSSYDVKLILYYLRDSPTKLKGAAMGVTRKTGATSLPVEVPSQLPNVFFLVESDGSWAFQDYQQRAMVSAFTRGDSGNCSIHCYVDGSTSGGICSAHTGATAGATIVPFTKIKAELVDG